VYSPLGRGFFSSGPKLVENLSEDDFRNVATVLCEYRVSHCNTCAVNNQLCQHKNFIVWKKKECDKFYLLLWWVTYWLTYRPHNTLPLHFMEWFAVKLCKKELLGEFRFEIIRF
jgi:hypothetical protein